MPTALLLGTLTLMAFLWFRSRQQALTHHDLAQAMRAFAAVFGSFATTGLAIGGRWGLAMVTFVATVAFARSLYRSWRGALPFGDEAGEARTETAYLVMRLDHSSGELDGVVKMGPFAGIVLSVMQLDELLALREEIRGADFDSLSLIDAFLDHAHPAWREQTNSGQVDEEPLDEARAREILGVSGDASVEDIKRAHRHLMGKVHPDRGGSAHLAAQVNAAKDLLLRLRQ